jgi:hypothetical protein
MQDNNKKCCSFSAKPEKQNPSWMTDLPNTLISNLTIPGTHDSCCKDAINSHLQTHIWSIEHQLEAGIRYFDIRCRHVDNEFHIYHSSFDCGISFKQVLNIMKLFLLTCPREAIVMRIKEENKPLNATRTFIETFDEEYMLYSDIFHITEGIPYLDDIRGKIWPILEFDYPYGFKWSSVELQDMWKVKNDEDVVTKISLMRGHFEKSILNTGELLYVNHCSCNGHLWPDEMAKQTNKVCFDYIGDLGIVVCDYPGEDFIEHLVRQNFKNSDHQVRAKQFEEINLSLNEEK